MKFLPIILTGLTALALGFFLGMFVSSYLPKTVPAKLIQSSIQPDEKLFTSLSATIRGKIQKVEGFTITVVNSSNITGTVKIGNGVIIRPITSGKTAPASSDISKLELNREVLISLRKINNEFQAYSIEYVPQLPTLKIPPP